VKERNGIDKLKNRKERNTVEKRQKTKITREKGGE
jgi:hypothetical protein